MIVLFDFTPREFVENGQLSQVLTGDDLPIENYYVHYQSTNHTKPAAKALLDFVVSKIKDL